MDLSFWTLVVGGAAGSALALFGMKVLVTGRAPAAVARSFRQIKDAGLYHLLFGLGLLVLVLGVLLPGGGVTGTATSALAVVMAGVAVVRYRPRGRRDEGEQHR